MDGVTPTSVSGTTPIIHADTSRTDEGTTTIIMIPNATILILIETPTDENTGAIVVTERDTSPKTAEQTHRPLLCATPVGNRDIFPVTAEGMRAQATGDHMTDKAVQTTRVDLL